MTVKFGQHFQEKHAVPAHEGLVGAAATLGRPVVVPDVSHDPRYLMVNPETRSELAVPLLSKGRVMGVMDLESPQLNYFTADHVQTLSILAASLAVSIENARLYEKVARDEARLERDLNAARRLQARCCRACRATNSGLDMAAHLISVARTGRRYLRFSALRSAGTGTGDGRREREGKRRRALRSCRDRNHAQPRPE